MEIINWRLKFQRRVQGSTRRFRGKDKYVRINVRDIPSGSDEIQKTSLAMKRMK